jgi:hypothetical protein
VNNTVAQNKIYSLCVLQSMDISRTNRSYRILQAALNQIGNNAGSHSTLAKMRVEPRANVGGMTARNIKLKDTKGDISTPKTSKLFSKTARGKISGTVKGTVRRLLFDDDIDFRVSYVVSVDYYCFFNF